MFWIVISHLCLSPLSSAQQANPPLVEKGQGESPFTVFDISEKEELIFRLVFGRQPLSEGLIGVSTRGGVLLPLAELSKILDLAFVVDPSLGQADGWFLSETRSFFLNARASEVVVEGQRSSFDSQAVWVGQDDIYVSTHLLSIWFPLVLHVDRSQLMISVETREVFPFQARLEREHRRKRLRGPGGPSSDFPVVISPYRWLDWPAVDLSVRSNYSSVFEKITSQYSAVMSQDLLWMNSTMFVTGNELDAVTNARATVGRQSVQRDLFGPLQMSEFLVGDVFNPQIPLVAHGQAGAGMVLSSFPLFQQLEFDRTSLRGDLPPAWEVELYRNEVLLASQASRGDGRYEFVDVPLVYGANVLRLIFYGPQAQKREKIQTIVVGQGLAGSGMQYVRVSANLDGTDVYDFIEEDPGQNPKKEFGDLTRYLGEYQFGLTDNISLSASVASLPVERVRRNYGSVGLRASLFGTFSRIHVSQDFSGGRALELATQTWLKRINLFFQHSHTFDYLSERTMRGGDALERESTLRLDTVLPSVWYVPSLPLTLNSTWGRTESGRETLNVFNRLSWFGFGVSASHSMDWIFYLGKPPGLLDEGNGSLLLNGRVSRLLLRGQFDYNIAPQAQASALSLTTDFSVSRQLSVRTGVRHQLNPMSRTSYSGGINYQNPSFGLGVTGQVDSEGIYSVNMALTFSLGWNSATSTPLIRSDRLATTGAVVARVFLDHNRNGSYDGDDEPLPGVTFFPSGRQIQTDEEGTAVIPGLSRNISTAVSVNPRSLENPYWSLTQPGYQLVTRPGKSTLLNFPVVMTGEVDGTVYLTQGDSMKAVSNVQLQLIDYQGEMIQEVKSAYDGFYLFSKVLPGTYRIQVAPLQAERLGLQAIEEMDVRIQGEDNVVSGVDILLQRFSKPLKP